MIAYARNGCSNEAIKLFKQTKYLGISPNDGILVIRLSSYSQEGLVKEAYQYLTSMNDYYHITSRTLYI